MQNLTPLFSYQARIIVKMLVRNADKSFELLRKTLKNTKTIQASSPISAAIKFANAHNLSKLPTKVVNAQYYIQLQQIDNQGSSKITNCFLQKVIPENDYDAETNTNPAAEICENRVFKNLANLWQ